MINIPVVSFGVPFSVFLVICGLTPKDWLNQINYGSYTCSL